MPKYGILDATQATMIARRKLYAIHRWIGLIVGLQLLAWSGGGLLFSVLEIGEVRGELDMRPRPASPLDATTIRASTADVVHVASRRWGAERVVEIRLRNRRGAAVYEIRDADGEAIGSIDAKTGEVVRQLEPEEAGNVALEDFAPEAAVTDVTLIESSPPLEYRGKPLPVYRVALDHPKRPHIYVSRITGEVTARRNARWRLFDFFWMLHIMDYEEREDFNHPLLTVFSALAVLSALSGLVLHAVRANSRRNRRRAA
jgi:uncharacterized iron-regulated membrane protein